MTSAVAAGPIIRAIQRLRLHPYLLDRRLAQGCKQKPALSPTFSPGEVANQEAGFFSSDPNQ